MDPVGFSLQFKRTEVRVNWVRSPKFQLLVAERSGYPDRVPGDAVRLVPAACAGPCLLPDAVVVALGGALCGPPVLADYGFLRCGGDGRV